MAADDKRLRQARRWALAWGALLFTLTSWPRPPEVPILSGIPHFDKLVHFGLYSVEAFWIYRAVRWPGLPGFSLARILAIVGVMAVWGAADETHQYWIPGRSMEGGDVMADITGGCAGAAVASVLAADRGRGRSRSALGV